MITTTSRIEDKKPSKFILPPMGILGIVPCAKDVDYITQDLVVSSVSFGKRIGHRPSTQKQKINALKITLEDIQVHQKLLQTKTPDHQASILDLEKFYFLSSKSVVLEISRRVKGGSLKKFKKRSLEELKPRSKDTIFLRLDIFYSDLWLQVQIFYDHVNPVTRQTIDQSAGGKLRDLNAEESWELLEDLALYDNESLNDPRDFAKPVKAIALPQDVPSTSDHRLIELKNQVQFLMEAHLALTQPTQVNKITTSCEICSGPHDTQYCMENPEQAFVEYASSRTDEARGKWYTFKPEQNNLGDTYNPSWKSHLNLRWRQPQNSENNFPNPPNRFQPNGSIPNRSFNNRPQNFNNQSNIEGLVSIFMASQDARLYKFEADFKRQQGLFARSYPTQDPQCSNHVHGSINAITIYPKKPNKLENDKSEEKEHGKEESPEDTNTMIHNDKKGDTSQLELKGTTNLGPNKNDDEIEWLDVEESLDLVDTRNMSYVMDFTILKSIETNIDMSLSNVVFGRPFVEIACLAINRKYGLMTFTNGIKKITFKTPYKDPEKSELSSEGHDLLSSWVILSEDHYDRGCRRPSDLEIGL
ncbi:hypothetical protein Tco_0870250 [Tanacetum coccineum]